MEVNGGFFKEIRAKVENIIMKEEMEVFQVRHVKRLLNVKKGNRSKTAFITRILSQMVETGKLKIIRCKPVKTYKKI